MWIQRGGINDIWPVTYMKTYVIPRWSNYNVFFKKFWLVLNLACTKFSPIQSSGMFYLKNNVNVQLSTLTGKM